MAIQLVVDRSTVEHSAPQWAGGVFLDPEAMAGAGLAVGELVKIQTPVGRPIPARLGPPDPADSGRGIIRLDRFLRQATKARLNQTVEVERLDPRDVVSITLLPAVDVSTAAPKLQEHLKRAFVLNQTPVGLGSILYATFPDSVAGTTYRVTAIEGGPGVIAEETELRLEYLPESAGTQATLEVTFEDVGGLDRQIQLVRELVQLPLQFPSLYRQLGINPSRGILFYGPPGTGKTHLARAVANETSARFYYINGPDIVGSLHGETEGNLRRLFAEASHTAPSVIFIDELDAIAPKRGETGAQSDSRAVTQLLSLMDGLRQVEGVIVIGTTNRIEAVDVALRRPGRFDREIFFGTPDTAGRLQILQIHSREMPLSPEALDRLRDLAEATPGFVGADLMELCREAGLNALRRMGLVKRRALDAFELRPEEVRVEYGDFEASLAEVRPSALREAFVSIPKVRWDDVGGLDETKARLKDLIERPLKRPEIFKALGLSPPRGILLYGPSGTGKTMLAQAVATECRVNFLSLDGPEIFTKWLGESEEGIRHAFRLARQLAPTILFFDQLDAIAPIRGRDQGSKTTERVVNQLLTEMDGVEPLTGVIVLAATNRLDIVEPAVLRPGRFDTHLFVPLPDQDARAKILRLQLRGLAFTAPANEAAVVEFLVERTEGLSGAELRAICNEAKLAILAESDGSSPVAAGFRHFERALERVLAARADYAQGLLGKQSHPVRQRRSDF